MSGKIKVLHVVGKMHPGGIETLLMNVYRHTDREKYEFHFAVQTEEKAFYDDEIESLGGKILRQPHPQRGLSRFRRELESNIRENGPYAAIHSHIFGFSGYVLKIAKGLGIPVRISHSHTVHRDAKQPLLRRIYRAYMQRLILKNATHLLGCSRLACESLFGKNCWGDKRVMVFPNAIALDPYESLPMDRSALRANLGILNPNAPVFAHIGRFQEMKNHSFLIDRFAEFSMTCPEARLILIGDGPERGRIEEQVRRLGLTKQVEFLGQRKDIPELLGAVDGFVLPSLIEGLGIVVIEAQAAGVPCLVSEAVPEEADLELGLVHKLRLDDHPNRWVQGLGLLAATPQPAWTMRRMALEKSGFNMVSSVRRLEHLYEG
ncbi:glycosyltransferase family 1 protein [Paenibacillus mendelii]|uniref:Glycosyltransferase family 1 protein n=1 Tax=Paenibacillus mendelii TaxID=206163 RepID=A0ABV6J4Q5_9BACL|nr:glycosyltransferase family 1 protein [Paenibacillus mendelii]MCQ6560436.1 glycosyltransferase family 1 protein [Paenibacillus mendelii]